jgi:acyl-CoA synthetase (AMP-forming)/AMP-acid ligase II
MPLPTGASGPLRFRSPCISSGYAGPPQPDGTNAFRNGWFYSNDVGYVTPDGLVYLAGRKNDIINLSGVKLDPERIEAAILQDETIKECVVVDVPGRLGQPLLVAVVVGGDAGGDDALRRRCLAVDPSAVPKIVLRAQSLPRNASGKILRAKVREGVRLKAKEET